MGAQIGFGLVLLVALFVGSVVGFLRVPHLMLAATIPLFALIPAAKLFVTPRIGPLKDLVSLAAITAAGAVIALERRPGRRRVVPDGSVQLEPGLWDRENELRALGHVVERATVQHPFGVGQAILKLGDGWLGGSDGRGDGFAGVR